MMNKAPVSMPRRLRKTAHSMVVSWTVSSSGTVKSHLRATYRFRHSIRRVNAVGDTVQQPKAWLDLHILQQST